LPDRLVLLIIPRMPAGGFVFHTARNILPDVPPQNILAMFEAVEEFA